MKHVTKPRKRQVRTSKKPSAKELRAQRDSNGRELIQFQHFVAGVSRNLTEDWVPAVHDYTLPAVASNKLDFLVGAAYHDALDRIDNHIRVAAAALDAAGTEALNAAFYAINPLFQTKSRSKNG